MGSIFAFCGCPSSAPPESSSSLARKTRMDYPGSVVQVLSRGHFRKTLKFSARWGGSEARELKELSWESQLQPLLQSSGKCEEE